MSACKSWGEVGAELGFLTLVSGAVALPMVICTEKELCRRGVEAHWPVLIAKIVFGLAATFLVAHLMREHSH